MQSALKITLEEFALAFQRAKPPTGWGKTIAVAYSGGVDSTCLLYLVNKHLQQRKDLPSLLAIHVDHGFRQTSQQNAEQCQKWAQSYSIPSIMQKIPWNLPPFSRLPIGDGNKEAMGRTARYKIIFDIMKEQGINVVLMAHHLDDQIETAVMRYQRSRDDPEKGVTTATGLAGMRPCRRWGMGKPPDGSAWFYGLEGMSSWVSRPLLDFPKERLIATAREEGLAYVEDETNGDANLTERNAIRSAIQKGDASVSLNWPYNPIQPERMKLAPSNPSLPNTAREYAILRDDVDQAVNEYLAKYTEPSPPGTYHIITSTSPPPSKIIQFGIILRILRYVSPLPWGSPHAEAKRESEALERIAAELWPYKHKDRWLDYKTKNLFSARTPFAGGSFVLWRPTPCVGITTRTILNTIDPRRTTEKTYGWLAQRQPPSRSTPVHVDITSQLTSRKPFNILWDGRWNIEVENDAIDILHEKIRERKMKQEIGEGRYVVTAEDQWYTPCIKYVSSSPDLGPRKTNFPLVSAHESRLHAGIKMKFIRPIDVI